MPDGPWPYLPTLVRLVLALALGLFVGLERERRGKEAGVRTFAFASLLGCLGGLLGEVFAVVALASLALLIVILNWQSMRSEHGIEMTTSAALLVTGFVGVLCGKGHTFTPVAVGIVTAALLAWKQPLAGFSTGLTETELRSAILLGILSFVIYPVLPARPVDPWGLIEPRTAWMTVIIIAAIGFGNYLLLKLFGQHGVEVTGFLGGLVNSTVAVAELSARVREVGASLASVAYRGVMLSDAAMTLRNAALLGILSLPALGAALVPLALMLVTSAALAWVPVASLPPASDTSPLRMESPFSLQSALKYGLVFLVLSIAGILAQRFLGQVGFYAVSIAGGFVSSASAVASAGSLAANGSLSPAVAGNGAVLASLTSLLVNLPLVSRISGERILTLRVAQASLLVALVGVGGIWLQSVIAAHVALLGAR